MLGKLDTWLMEHPKRDDLYGWRRFAVEFWFFGLKEARACLFAGLFFIAMFLIPKTGWLGVSRYDLLLIFAVSVQVAMLYFKLETWDEVKSITLFTWWALLWSGSKHRATSSLGAIRTRHTPKSAACRCLQALCMRRSAATSFRLGGSLISESKAIRRIG